MVRKIALILLLPLLVACTGRQETKELRLYTWSDYFKPEMIRAFEAETGAKVKVDYFASNEQLLTKLQLLQGEARGYDLIVPSDYMVRILVERKMLQPLDKARMPFLADFEPKGLNPPYDPGLQFTVPLSVGLTGIAWNSKLLPKLPANFGWKNFFEQPELKGQVTLIDDGKEVLQAALLAQGRNLEEASEEDMRAAFAYLEKNKKQLKAFTSETRPVIEADECMLCMAYSGDVLSISRNKPEIRFVLPADGATIWSDSFAIPANAGAPDLAYAFMAKVLSAEGAKEFTEKTGYRTFHRKAKALLPKEITNSPVVYPPESENFHYLVEKKEFAPLVDKEWARMKSL